MKRIVALAASIVLLASAPALAQLSEGQGGVAPQGGVSAGVGIQRGLESMNQSGENGFITLFGSGAETRVVVDVHGMKPSATQTVAIQRGKSCAAIEPKIVARSGKLVGGMSRGAVPLSTAALMSGNYVAVVYSSTDPGAQIVACGHLPG
jgi:opacity protein-like surface antigen